MRISTGSGADIGSSKQPSTFAMVEAYSEIGRSIIEQQGNDESAGYGEAPLKGPAKKLTAEFGKGFDVRNHLRFMRQFYLAFPIRDALRTELSRTHYRRLSRIPDSDTRMWYMNEGADSRWSTRQLERQINTMFRERLLASEDKQAVSAEIEKSAPGPRPEDITRDPHVLEFPGFSDDAAFRESDLERAQKKPIVEEDRLGFGTFYYQAKRWDPNRTVGRPDVQAFVGALSGKGTSKGLFITTASFSQEARSYAESLRAQKVVLIDGNQLAKLMTEYNVGVSTRTVYEVKALDSNFFEEEEKRLGAYGLACCQ